MQRRIVVAINPSAAFGRASDAGPRTVELLKAAGHEVQPIVAPDYARLVDRAGEAIAVPPDAFIVVGGDGMVHLGANLLAGTGIPLGLVPVGTGNDLALSAGIARHRVEAAVSQLLGALDHGARSLDTGIAEWAEDGVQHRRRFLGAVSCGFDAIVNERANRMRHPKGASRYTIALARELARLRPIAYRIEWDGGVIEQPGALVSVANNRSIGGGMRIVPEASMTDGLLDLFVVEALGRLEFLRLYPLVFSGGHASDPRVTILRTRRARVEAADVVAYADGERLGPLPIDVTVDPASLEFLWPPEPEPEPGPDVP